MQQPQVGAVGPEARGGRLTRTMQAARHPAPIHTHKVAEFVKGLNYLEG